MKLFTKPAAPPVSVLANQPADPRVDTAARLAFQRWATHIAELLAAQDKAARTIIARAIDDTCSATQPLPTSERAALIDFLAVRAMEQVTDAATTIQREVDAWDTGPAITPEAAHV